MRRRILFIRNPAAGRRRLALLDGVVAGLKDVGAEPTVETTTAPDHAVDLARRAEADLVVAAGGDGTVNEVVHGLMTRGDDGTRPAFATLPLGTINVLALELGLPRTATELAATLLNGPEIQVPVGWANGRHFLLTAGAGADAAAVSFLSSQLKKIIGRGAYYLALMHALATEGGEVFTVEIGDRSYQVSSVIVTNASRYAGDKVVAPSLRLTDDVMHVLLGLSHGRRHLVRYGLAYMRGTLPFQSDVQVVPTRQLRIAAPAGKPVQLDGDNRLITPVDITVAKETLAVVAPSGGSRAPV